MKLDIIVGNPPYQLGNQSIYQKFIDKSIELEPKIINMIVKNTWLNSNTLSETRENIVEFGLDSIIDYTVPKELFKEANTQVCILNMIRAKQSEKFSYTEIRNGEVVDSHELETESILRNGAVISSIEHSIIESIERHKEFYSYGIIKNVRIFSIGSNGRFMLADRTIDCIKYTDNKNECMHPVEVIFMDGSHNKYSRYTEFDELPKGKEYVDKYKIACGSKVHNNEYVVTNLCLMEHNQIMTNSFSIVGLADSKCEATNIHKYIQTKFFRYLVKLMIPGRMCAIGVGTTKHVPMQNFGIGSDIDWNSSIENIDKQLYEKYGLNSEQVNEIETTIKYERTS